MSLFTRPYVNTNLHNFLSSMEQKRRYFEEHWEPISLQRMDKKQTKKTLRHFNFGLEKQDGRSLLYPSCLNHKVNL